MSLQMPVATEPIRSSLTPAELRACFDREPFLFSHGLAGHRLFELPRLMEVARSAARRPGDLYFDSGDIRVDQQWGQIPISEMTYIQALNRIETAGAWMIMKHVELDPAYARVLEDCTDGFLGFAEPSVRAMIKNPEMLVIVSSPNRITPFHIDGECNFLVQVHGTKTVRVFNRGNRSVLAEEEIERFYALDGCPARFKEGIDIHARQIELTPGTGVHIPVLFPHWVRNGPEVSVSLSINYEFPESYRADIYRANWHLRKAGWKPARPGVSAWRDSLKARAYRSLSSLRKR